MMGELFKLRPVLRFGPVFRKTGPKRKTGLSIGFSFCSGKYFKTTNIV